MSALLNSLNPAEQSCTADAGGSEPCDPRVEALVNELIGRVADKWTMIVIEVLTEKTELRFTQLARQVPGISQKMLTQTLRGMERDGMVTRTVHPVVPPRVDYRLTDLGASLGEAFCGVWLWAEQNLARVEGARKAFDGAAWQSRSPTREIAVTRPGNRSRRRVGRFLRQPE